MPAEVETMIYAGDVPWHGFGTYVGDDDVDSKTAIIKAGLDWEVEKKPILFEDSRGKLYNNIPTHHAIVREHDQHVLGVVGSTYKPIQNHEAFTFMDSLVGAGQMKYHTAGSLRDGRNIWLLGKVGQVEVLPNDQVDQYLMLYNSHDGKGSLRCFFTVVRVVCANTAAAALKESGGVRLRHTTLIQNHLVEAQTVLGLANDTFTEFGQFAKQLTKVQLDTSDWENFTKTVFPDPIDQKGPSRAEGKRVVLTDLFEDGIGQDIKGVAGTAWAAYNAVVEFSNYYRPARNGNDQEKRFIASTLGSKTSLINRATQELIKLAA